MFRRRGLTSALQLLFLLGMFLLQFLRLLRVLLFQLLLAGIIRILRRLALVLRILLLLQFLAFLVLLRDQLVVPLLQLLVARRISGVGGVRLTRRQIFRMYCRRGPGASFRPSCVLRPSRFFTILRSRLFGGLVAGTVRSFGAG